MLVLVGLHLRTFDKISGGSMAGCMVYGVALSSIAFPRAFALTKLSRASSSYRNSLCQTNVLTPVSFGWPGTFGLGVRIMSDYHLDE
eukprot:5012992-Pyramimonas_sp.AAC.1